MRALLKTITFRVIALAITFIISYLVTGHIGFSIKLTILLNLSKSIAYFIHEKLWEKI